MERELNTTSNAAMRNIHHQKMGKGVPQLLSRVPPFLVCPLFFWKNLHARSLQSRVLALLMCARCWFSQSLGVAAYWYPSPGQGGGGARLDHLGGCKRCGV